MIYTTENTAKELRKAAKELNVDDSIYNLRKPEHKAKLVDALNQGNICTTLIADQEDKQEKHFQDVVEFAAANGYTVEKNIGQLWFESKAPYIYFKESERGYAVTVAYDLEIIREKIQEEIDFNLYKRDEISVDDAIAQMELYDYLEAQDKIEETITIYSVAQQLIDALSTGLQTAKNLINQYYPSTRKAVGQFITDKVLGKAKSFKDMVRIKKFISSLSD